MNYLEKLKKHIIPADKTDKSSSDPFASTYQGEISKKTETLTVDEESKIRSWLRHIEETDPHNITEIIERCRNNLGARKYFLLQFKCNVTHNQITKNNKPLKS